MPQHKIYQIKNSGREVSAVRVLTKEGNPTVINVPSGTTQRFVGTVLGYDSKTITVKEVG